MRIQHFFLVVLAHLTAWETCTAIQDQQVEETQAAEAENEAMQQRVRDAGFQCQSMAMHTELYQLKEEFNIDEEWIESQRESLESEIKKLVDNMQPDHASLLLSSSKRYLDRRIRDQLWSNIQNKVTEEKQSEFDVWKRRFHEMQRIRDNTAINTVLATLDGELCLSRSQIEKLRKLYAKDWDPIHNGDSIQLANSGARTGTDICFVIDRETINQVLSVKQRQAFSELGQSGKNMMALLREADGGVYQNSNSLREECKVAMDLKVEEYLKLIEIDERQSKLIGIASKGAINGVLNQLDDFFKKSASTPKNMTKIMVVSEPFPFKFAREIVWQNALSEILDKAQMQKITKRESDRRVMHFQTAVSNMSLMISEMVNSELTHEQYTDLFTAIAAQLDDNVAPNCLSILEELPKMPDSMFQEILTEAQWRILKPLLERARARAQ